MCRRKMLLLIYVTFIILNKITNVNTQNCSGVYYQIICRDIIDKFPDGMSFQTSLQCDNCNVPTLGNETLHSFTGPTFNMTNSHIKTIRNDAFEKFPSSVGVFVFNNNELTEIVTGMFNKFKSLRLLEFRNNSIKYLTPNQFDGLIVFSLVLSQNQIEDIPVGAFSGLTTCHLDISKNKIKEIRVGMFTKLKQEFAYDGWYYVNYRHSIILSSNEIRSVEKGSFEGIVGLEKLFLKNNYITTVKNDTFLGVGLKKLDMKNNKLRNLEPNAFRGMAKLSELSLNNNQITEIPLGLFSTLESLITLNLTHNHLKELGPMTFSGLIKLENLDLSHNFIGIIQPSLLIPLDNLFKLYINYNRLKSVNFEEILKHNKRIRQLDINHNFWQCSDLVRLNKLENREYLVVLIGSDFNVPNLHGTACSKNRIDVKEHLTFDHFLDLIAQDLHSKDLYDDNKSQSNVISEEEKSSPYTAGIFYLILVPSVIYTVLTLKRLFDFLKKRNTPKNRLTVAYNSEANIGLI